MYNSKVFNLLGSASVKPLKVFVKALGCIFILPTVAHMSIYAHKSDSAFVDLATHCTYVTPSLYKLEDGSCLAKATGNIRLSDLQSKLIDVSNLTIMTDGDVLFDIDFKNQKGQLSIFANNVIMQNELQLTSHCQITAEKLVISNTLKANELINLLVKDVEITKNGKFDAQNLQGYIGSFTNCGSVRSQNTKLAVAKFVNKGNFKTLGDIDIKADESYLNIGTILTTGIHNVKTAEFNDWGNSCVLTMFLLDCQNQTFKHTHRGFYNKINVNTKNIPNAEKGSEFILWGSTKVNSHAGKTHKIAGDIKQHRGHYDWHHHESFYKRYQTSFDEMCAVFPPNVKKSIPERFLAIFQNMPSGINLSSNKSIQFEEGRATLMSGSINMHAKDKCEFDKSTVTHGHFEGDKTQVSATNIGAKDSILGGFTSLKALEQLKMHNTSAETIYSDAKETLLSGKNNVQTHIAKGKKVVNDGIVTGRVFKATANVIEQNNTIDALDAVLLEAIDHYIDTSNSLNKGKYIKIDAKNDSELKGKQEGIVAEISLKEIDVMDLLKRVETHLLKLDVACNVDIAHTVIKHSLELQAKNLKIGDVTVEGYLKTNMSGKTDVTDNITTAGKMHLAGEGPINANYEIRDGKVKQKVLTAGDGLEIDTQDKFSGQGLVTRVNGEKTISTVKGADLNSQVHNKEFVRTDLQATGTMTFNGGDVTADGAVVSAKNLAGNAKLRFGTTKYTETTNTDDSGLFTSAHSRKDEDKVLPAQVVIANNTVLNEAAHFDGSVLHTKNLENNKELVVTPLSQNVTVEEHIKKLRPYITLKSIGLKASTNDTTVKMTAQQARDWLVDSWISKGDVEFCANISGHDNQATQLEMHNNKMVVSGTVDSKAVDSTDAHVKFGVTYNCAVEGGAGAGFSSSYDRTHKATTQKFGNITGENGTIIAEGAHVSIENNQMKNATFIEKQVNDFYEQAGASASFVAGGAGGSVSASAKGGSAELEKVRSTIKVANETEPANRQRIEKGTYDNRKSGSASFSWDPNNQINNPFKDISSIPQNLEAWGKAIDTVATFVNHAANTQINGHTFVNEKVRKAVELGKMIFDACADCSTFDAGSTFEKLSAIAAATNATIATLAAVVDDETLNKVAEYTSDLSNLAGFVKNHEAYCKKQREEAEKKFEMAIAKAQKLAQEQEQARAQEEQKHREKEAHARKKQQAQQKPKNTKQQRSNSLPVKKPSRPNGLFFCTKEAFEKLAQEERSKAFIEHEKKLFGKSRVEEDVKKLGEDSQRMGMTIPEYIKHKNDMEVSRELMMQDTGLTHRYNLYMDAAPYVAALALSAEFPATAATLVLPTATEATLNAFGVNKNISFTAKTCIDVGLTPLSGRVPVIIKAGIEKVLDASGNENAGKWADSAKAVTTCITNPSKIPQTITGHCIKMGAEQTAESLGASDSASKWAGKLAKTVSDHFTKTPNSVFKPYEIPKQPSQVNNLTRMIINLNQEPLSSAMPKTLILQVRR